MVQYLIIIYKQVGTIIDPILYILLFYIFVKPFLTTILYWVHNIY